MTDAEKQQVMAKAEAVFLRLMQQKAAIDLEFSALSAERTNLLAEHRKLPWFAVVRRVEIAGRLGEIHIAMEAVDARARRGTELFNVLAADLAEATAKATALAASTPLLLANNGSRHVGDA